MLGLKGCVRLWWAGEEVEGRFGVREGLGQRNPDRGVHGGGEVVCIFKIGTILV